MQIIGPTTQMLEWMLNLRINYNDEVLTSQGVKTHRVLSTETSEQGDHLHNDFETYSERQAFHSVPSNSQSYSEMQRLLEHL